MKKKIPFKRLVVMLIALILITGSVAGQQYRNGIRQGTVRVKFKPQLSATLNSVQASSVNGVLHTGIQAFDRANAKLSAVSMKRVFPYSAKHEAKHKRYGLDLWYEVIYTSNVDPKVAIGAYSSLEEVGMAEPIRQKTFEKGEVKYAPTSSGTGAPFNDTYLADQWHYNNTGELATSVAGGDISLYKAWEIETGKPNVVVCIVDGGVDVDHEDLAANMWINEAEKNGEEGVDDDGNGYVDDIHGYNFVAGSGNITHHFHGTHVAGTVGAVNNNGIGVAGVAGGSGNNDGIRLMSSQIFTEDGGNGNSAAAIVYGADNGAVISQNSWGYPSPGYVEQAILDAIDYFIAEAGSFAGSPMRGGVVFFAAGNDNSEGDYYPGYYESAISVSALGPDLKKAGYSNYGSWVDIAAPGGNNDYGVDHSVLSTLPNDKYGYLDGTSMACPHVAGVAALVVSKYGNSTFTNEDLKVQLLTGTPDIDEYNPGYAGKLGIGYTDAFLALQTDNGIVPNSVVDLNLIGIAQDFASLSWTIPADEDDGMPASFEVLYSTEEIINENADLAEKLSLSMTSADTLGATVEMDVHELKPTTTYYFAIRSIDRWGNVSQVSNVASGTTNTGPAINTDKQVMNFTIDASLATTASDVFSILNEDKGVLKWEGSTRHKNTSLSYNMAGLNYPEANLETSSKKIAFGPKILKQRATANAISTVSSVEPMANFYEEYYYGRESVFGIGEMDTTFTNSMATRYKVSQADGFNLTFVQAYLNHTPGTGPMILEIYQGDQINEKNLVYAQEFTSYGAYEYWHNEYLKEQLFFEQGTTFWIVIHVPSGNLYPLGVDLEAVPEYSNNCLMSFDMGKSWSSLESIIEDDRYVWAVAAVSKNQHLGNYITLNPSSGVVEGNSSQEVELSLDASTLINGTYSANVVLTSNDGDDRYFRMPVNLNVSGHEPKLVNETVVDFGGVFFGHDKELTITIQNTGYGNFNVMDVISTDDQFKIVSQPWQIAARDEATITIHYTPDGPGNDNGTIELTDAMGRTQSINLFGVAIAPSEIEISLAEQQLADMALGEEANASFSIINTGEYPLEYVIPSFAPDVKIEGMDNIHLYGYTLESNANGDTSAVYDWEDISSTGTDVTEHFKNVSYDNRYKEVELGFEFPFYGEKIERINLTRYGLLSLSEEGALGNCWPSAMNDGCAPEGFISAFGVWFDLNKTGHIYYSRKPGKFIVQYQNVLQEYAWDENKTVTFQIVLFYNGDIEFRYKDVQKFDFWALQDVLIAVGDRAYSDGFRVNGARDYTDKIKGKLNSDETVFRLKSPGQNMIRTVSEPYGIVKVGESKNIDLTLSTVGMYESNLYQRLSVVSNDPFHNPAAFTVKVNVTSGGESNVSVSQDTIAMGQVFQGGARRETLLIQNEGSKDVEITSVSLQNSKFNLNVDAPVLLKAKSSHFVFIDLPTVDKGVVEDHLIVNTSEGQSFDVYLHAEIVPAPGIDVDVTPITETLEAGDMVTRTISVQNNGEADLEIVPAYNDWLHLADIEAKDASLKNFSYYALTSDDEDGPAYNWEDVRETGNRISIDWYFDNDVLVKAVPLPYEVEFYNQPVDTLWISWEGAVFMSEPDYDYAVARDMPIPTNDELNNFIAPYFTWQGYDWQHPEYDTQVGVFYKIYDDRIVVQWAEYVDLFTMGGNYSFEAILYKNGNIKFQYKAGGWVFTELGTIGVENEDATDGLQLAHKQEFFKDGLAVSIIPAEKQIIPVGQSKDLKVALDAKYLNKGEYTGNFRIFNNTPQNGEVIVPVTLTVNGAPTIETLISIDYGNVMAYQINGEFGPEPMSYNQEFKVKNTGTDILSFSNIGFTETNEAKVELEYSDPIFGFKEWQEINPWNLPAIAPGDHVNMRVRLLPVGDNAEINGKLVFTGNLPEGDYLLPVHAQVSLPPVMVLEQDSVSVMANTPDYEEVRTVTIDNTNGQSALDYQLGINFKREGEVENAETASIETFVSTPLVSLGTIDADIKGKNAQPFADDTYNAILEYDTLAVPANAVGFGESMAFISSTAFQAPEIGFNLTHVKTWYNYVDVVDSRITVEIRAGGTGVADAKVLTRESFDVNVETPVQNGEYFTFELSENQIFYPGETFYVVFEYALGVALPQAIADGVEDVPGRFMYSDGAEWGDIQAAGYYGEGWMVKAMEKEHKSKSWVVLDSGTEGSVPAGEIGEVNLKFIASDAQDVDNFGELTIISNDPHNTDGAVDLHLRLNQGPDFALESEELVVNENETLNFVVIANDVEGDACSYALAEEYDFIQMSVQNDTITLVYAPDFEADGLNTFTLKGEDVHGNATKLDIPVEVMNVNRAPELINEVNAMDYYQDETMDHIDLTQYFSDPDGEVLTWEFNSSDISIANIYTWENGIMIEPMMDGMAEVTLTARDSEGLTAETTFTLNIGTITGIEDVEGSSETKVYPVPTSGPLNIVLGSDIEGEVNISIIDVAGLTQYQTSVNKMSGEHIERLNISNMPSGIYLVKITSAKGDIVKRVVKI